VSVGASQRSGEKLVRAIGGGFINNVGHVLRRGQALAPQRQKDQFSIDTAHVHAHAGVYLVHLADATRVAIRLEWRAR
jgi:hypothetical protein